MQLPDLNLLVALDALLEEGSVWGAAKRMHLSPAAMSRTLGRIREATGDPILVRAGRQLVPSARALAMRARVRAALEESAQLLGRDAQQSASTFQRTLSIRVDDAVTSTLAPRLLSRIRAEAPLLKLSFVAEGEEDVAALRDGTVDLDIGVQGPLGPEIRSRKLLRDAPVLIAAKRGALGKGSIELERFARAEHVVASRRRRERGPVDELLAKRGLTRVVRAVVPNQLAAATLVAQSDLIAVVSGTFAKAVAPLLGLRVVAPPLRLPSMDIALAWHPRHDRDPAHTWLREQVYELCDG